jgi:hypothetical protein
LVVFTNFNSLFRANFLILFKFKLGKHEDQDIKGKGLDLAFLIKDFNLIKWIQGKMLKIFFSK